MVREFIINGDVDTYLINHDEEIRREILFAITRGIKNSYSYVTCFVIVSGEVTYKMNMRKSEWLPFLNASMEIWISQEKYEMCSIVKELIQILTKSL